MIKQRERSWTPVIVSNAGNQSRDNKLVCAFDVLDVDESSEETTTDLKQKFQRRADLRFALGIALALALPAFIGFGIYMAAESLIILAS